MIPSNMPLTASNILSLVWRSLDLITPGRKQGKITKKFRTATKYLNLETQCMLLEIHHTVVMGTTKTPLTSKGELYDLENFKVSSDSKYAF